MCASVLCMGGMDYQMDDCTAAAAASSGASSGGSTQCIVPWLVAATNAAELGLVDDALASVRGGSRVMGRTCVRGGVCVMVRVTRLRDEACGACVLCALCALCAWCALPRV